jgi:hypothetical protein
MSASGPPSGGEGRAALLLLQRLLAETDRSLSVGDIRAAQAALGRVASAFDFYRLQRPEGSREHATESALGAARRAALLRLGRLLADIDALLLIGDLEAIQTALAEAKDAAENSHALDESAAQSGIRARFPSRFAK